MASDSQYAAFISYSRTDGDLEWARWLQTALETYRIPRAVRRQYDLPKRLKPVFRDESELGAAPSLGQSIDDALSASESLIVVCSPESQRSQWVQAEVSRFIQLGRRSRVILVLVEGSPEQSFPLAFLEKPRGSDNLASPPHAHLPLAADGRPDSRLSLQARRNRVRLAVISAVLSLEPDELARRHHQRQVRSLTALAGILLTVTAVMIGLTVVAITQKQEAEKQERSARKRLADSKIQQGGALVLTNRWSEGFAAFDEARQLLESLDSPLLPMGLKMIEAEQRSLIPYEYLRLPDVSGIAISQKGTRLAVAAGNAIHIIDLILDRKIISLTAGGQRIDAFALSADGSTVAVAVGAEVRLLDATTGEVFAVPWSHAENIEALRFSPAEPVLLIAGSKGQVLIWDLKTNELVALAAHDAAIADMDLSGDGSRLAVAWDDGTTEVCRLENNQCNETVRIDAGEVVTVALSSDGRWAATGDGQFLRFWDGRTGSFLSESTMGTEQVRFVGDLVFSSDGDGDITTFDVTSGTTMGSFPSPPGLLPTHVEFSQERLALLTSYEGAVLYWQMTFSEAPGSGQVIAVPEFGSLSAFAISPDGEFVTTGDTDGTLKVWDGFDLEPLLSIDAHRGAVGGIVFSRSGESLTSVGEDGRAVRWNLVTGEARRHYSHVSGELSSVDLSADGSQLAIGNKTGQVTVLGSETGELVSRFAVDGLVSSLAYGPDSSVLAIGTEGGRFYLWSVSSQALREVAKTGFEGHLRVSFRNRTEVLVVGDDAELWDIVDGRRVRRFAARAVDTSDAGLLGSTLYHAGGVERVDVFEIDSGNEVAALKLFSPVLLGASATADGRVFVAGGFSDIQIFRWEEAARRAQLRKEMSGWSVMNPEPASSQDRAEKLAEWHFLHGSAAVALDYVQHPEFTQRSIPSLTLGRILRANGRYDEANEHFAKAVEHGEISATWATLAGQAGND